MTRKEQDVVIHRKLSRKYLSVRNKQCFSLYYAYWHQEMQALMDLNKKTVLECGSGTGEFLKYLKDRGFCVAGCDISVDMLKFSYQDILGSICVGDTEKLPFADNAFDYVICKGSLHHLKNPLKGLEEMKRVLKEDGNIILSEPARGNSVWRKVALLYNSLKKSFSKDHKNFSQEELTALFTDSKLKLVKKKPFGFVGFLFFAMPQQFFLSAYFPFSKEIAKLFIRIDKFIAGRKIFASFSWHQLMLLAK